MANHLIGKSALFAIERHGDQKYGKKPYHVHLVDVVGVLRRFIEWDNLPQEYIDAAWLHDTIEDTSTTREEINVLFGKRVGDLVYAVTNESGMNREERHRKTYPKIRNIDHAITIKLADRIANVEQAISHDRFGRPPQKLFNMYLKEWDKFVEELKGKCTGEGDIEAMMWEYLVSLIEEGKEKLTRLKDFKSFNGEI